MRLVLFAALAVSAFGTWASPFGADLAEGCVFLRTPHTYEADRARTAYMAAIDAASVDALFPGDPFFGLETVEIGTRTNRSDTMNRRVPVSLLRAIAWVESSITMASRSVAFESDGRVLVSFDCGYGIMQVTTGMTVPLGIGQQPSETQVSVATHYVHNIARGAAILVNKWNRAPQSRPIVGTDTNSNSDLIENWYYAVWSYNGFTGPGDNGSNHPADPTFGGWPRSPYRCDGTQARNRYPYQELVWGCLASPPAPAGHRLWEPIPATLPNLTQVQYFTALALGNFWFPYVSMDIPTPLPAHFDSLPTVAPSFRAGVLASPQLSVDESAIELRTEGPSAQTRITIHVRNPGTGILSWVAETPDAWIVVDPPAGVALGGDIACNGYGCKREAEIIVTVNPTLLPAAASSGTLRISSPNASGAPLELRVDVNAEFEMGAPGTSRAY